MANQYSNFDIALEFDVELDPIPTYWGICKCQTKTLQKPKTLLTFYLLIMKFFLKDDAGALPGELELPYWIFE